MLLVFDMFMDDYVVLTICAPIFIPIAVFLGFDPIWYAIIFVLNMQVAYLTPPFGWALIMMRGVILRTSGDQFLHSWQYS